MRVAKAREATAIRTAAATAAALRRVAGSFGDDKIDIFDSGVEAWAQAPPHVPVPPNVRTVQATWGKNTGLEDVEAMR